MTIEDPLSKPKDTFDELIAQISIPDSPVGIDAKYTHAVIIDYLKQIATRVDELEQQQDKLIAALNECTTTIAKLRPA